MKNLLLLLSFLLMITLPSCSEESNDEDSPNSDYSHIECTQDMNVVITAFSDSIRPFIVEATVAYHNQPNDDINSEESRHFFEIQAFFMFRNQQIADEFDCGQYLR